MGCQRCGSTRVPRVSAKCSDMCYFDAPSEGISDQSDYAPYGIGIKGGDYVGFSYCLDCGQMQGNFPMGFPEETDGEVIYQIEDELERISATEACRGEQDCLMVELGVGVYRGKLRFFDNQDNEMHLTVGEAKERLGVLEDGAAEFDMGEVYRAMEGNPQSS